MCQEAAPGLEAQYERFGPDGFIVLTAASEAVGRRAVELADLQEWAAFYSLTFPVLADVGAEVDRMYDPERRTRPTYVLIAPGLEVVSVDQKPTDDDIAALLP